MHMSQQHRCAAGGWSAPSASQSRALRHPAAVLRSSQASRPAQRHRISSSKAAAAQGADPAEESSAAAAPRPPPVPHPSDITDPHQQRAVGCLLAGAAGACIGLSVEPERSFRITRLFPEGLTDPWRFHATAARPAPGDFAAAVAAAASLAPGGRARLGHLLDALAASYSPDTLSYSPYTALVLDALAAGADPLTLARQADGLLNLGVGRRATSSSDRMQRQPFGAADHGAAVRCAPLGVAYSGAADEDLIEAVDTWALFSHPSDLGRDGALAAAATTAWLAAAGPGAAPEALLDRLAQIVTTDDMRSRLNLVRGALSTVGQLPHIPSPASPAGADGGNDSPKFAGWREFWASDEWGRLVAAHTLLTTQGFATIGTQAVAVALLALVTNWQRPEQAVAVAASLGGSSSTAAALAGAFAGALHGCAWVPARWWEAMGALGEERRLRDAAVAAGVAMPRVAAGGGAAPAAEAAAAGA